MKIGIVFYSFSGNTRRVCSFLRQRIAKENREVKLFDLKLKKEASAFFEQCRQAFFRVKPELKGSDFSIEEYDYIIFASPVWAFTITPALRSYLEKIKNLNGKAVACFLTYGSGVGSQKALRELQKTIEAKQGSLIFSKNLKDRKTSDSVFLEAELKPLLDKIIQ